MVLLGTDGHPDYPPTVGDAMAIALSGTESEQLLRIFNALAEGGHVKIPLKQQAWGDIGFLVDQFGINWMVTIDKA